MKFRIIMAMLLAALLAVPAKGQESEPQHWAPTLGARAAMEVTVPSGGRNFYRTGAGLTAGVTIYMPLPRNFYFEPGVLMSYTAMTAKDLVSFDDEYYYEGAANVYSLRIPLMFGYSYMPTALWRFDFATGPWLNINLSARQRLNPNFSAPKIVPDRTVNLFRHGWKRVDALWGIALSATFADHYTIGITAGVAFTPLARYGDRDKKIRIHRNTIALSLGYNF